MDHLQISEDTAWPLRFLEVVVDKSALEILLSAVAKERPRRFKKITISGGIATQTNWSRTTKRIADWEETKKTGDISLLYGYFDPLKQEIVLFPETILGVMCAQQHISFSHLDQLTIDSQTQASFLKKIEKEFYPMLIEELEHGFQVSQKKHYQSLLSKLVQFTSPLIPVYVLISVIYVEFTQTSRWWHLVTFSLMLLWIFLPIWVSMIPQPKWLRKLNYTFNRREKDAKGIAVSLKFQKLAREAFTFQWL